MEVVVNRSIEINEPTAVAIGNFDGLHLGHQALINTMVEHSRKKEIKATVFTFNNHTTSILKNKKAPNILCNQEQTARMLSDMGVELLYMIDFNERIMVMTPKEFIKDILVDTLNAKLVVVGFNFRFGYKAKGDAKYLEKVGRELGVEVLIVPPVYNDKNIISSSYIRELIRGSRIEDANKLLGKPYTITGKVVPGKGRGKGLGVPTANLRMYNNYIIPQKGVYKTSTRIGNVTYESITNVGQNPTFSEGNISIETYLLDFNQDIYNKYIEVSFLEFIRNEIKFESEKKLIQQMKRDIEHVRSSS